MIFRVILTMEKQFLNHCDSIQFTNESFRDKSVYIFDRFIEALVEKYIFPLKVWGSVRF